MTVPKFKIFRIKAYKPGKSNLGKIKNIIKLSANESALGVSTKVNKILNTKNVTLFKPNLKELKEGVNKIFSFQEIEKFEEAVAILEEKLNNQISFITLSENGVFIKDKTTQHHVPAHIRNIADVSGAGDTVISVATLCLAAGMSIKDVAEIANLAGGLVCEKSGVVSIDKELLIKEVELVVAKH